MEKANITLYTVIGDPGRIETAIREHFKEMTKEFTPENGNILLTLADDSTISFNINHRQDKPDFIASHTAGMANYFSSAETPLVELKENVFTANPCIQLRDRYHFRYRRQWRSHQLYHQRPLRHCERCKRLPALPQHADIYPGRQIAILYQRRKPVDGIYADCQCRPAGRKPPPRIACRYEKTPAFKRPAQSKKHSLYGTTAL